MLLRTQRASGLSGEVLPNLFHEEDRARISEQFRTSTSQSATALNADILDSDFNRVKVELVCVQFDNLTNDRPWDNLNHSQCTFGSGLVQASPLKQTFFLGGGDARVRESLKTGVGQLGLLM